MFYKSRYYRHPEFITAVREIAPVSLGIGAWGLMTGVAMVKAGLSASLAAVYSILVFAGSAQLATVPLLIAGAPIWVIWTTAACVNLRFVVFSAHLRPYTMHLPLFERLQVGYLTGDMSYVLFTKRYPHAGQTLIELETQQAYLAGSCGTNFVVWHGMSLLGIALANFIPAAWGLGFAGILALIGILASLISTKLRALALVVSSSAAIAAFALPLKLNILAAICCAVAVCVMMEKTLEARAAHGN